ncbi:hypothetical protein MMC25_006857 [Agyrium rufum]|nr:hypothetical protein [Agyrium rufum]
MSAASPQPQFPAADGPRPLAPLAPSSTNATGPPSAKSLATHSILTGKEWVIPPRPKPGRKPAADTAPTKRKAQNRAAQRAFRERRAAKVSELEEQMQMMEEEDRKEQDELRAQVKEMELAVEQYSQIATAWENQVKILGSQLQEERRMRESMQRELDFLRSYQNMSTEAVPLPRRTGSKRSNPNPPTLESSSTQELGDIGDVPLGCGKCSLNTRCACIEEALNMDTFDTAHGDGTTKRPHSPSEERTVKHPRQDSTVDIKPDSEDLEIDFTSSFPPSLPHAASSFTRIVSGNQPPSNMESCGFCADGTACLCAELAAENAANRNDHSNKPANSSFFNSSVAPITISRLPSFAHNPTRSIEEVPAKPAKYGPKGPGTCAQCQSSPRSTLFCKSLAATNPPNRTNTIARALTSAATTLPTPSPPGSSHANEADLHVHNNGVASDPSRESSGPTLSCADAFTTLSRHPGFDRASDELGAWLPRLATVPVSLEGRTAFEIEAASVMGVLKFFDRRFGDSGEGRRC